MPELAARLQVLAVDAESVGNRLVARVLELDPDNARYGYVYAVGLQSAGQVDEAINVLEQLHGRHPGDVDTLYTLVLYLKETRRIDAANRYFARLKKLLPSNPAVLQLERELASNAG